MANFAPPKAEKPAHKPAAAQPAAAPAATSGEPKKDSGEGKAAAGEPAARPAVTTPAPPSAAAASAAPAGGPATSKPAAAVPSSPGAVSSPTAAKPAAPAKPAAKPAAAAAAEGVTRREFSWAAVAWVGFAAAIGGCVSAMTRFMFPNVLFEPPTTFKVGKPEDFPVGVVDTRFVDQYGVWIVNDGGRIYSLIAICTHLGYPPAWLPTQNKFKCPCHGSGYYKSGVNFEGPTPRPLERARIYISPDDGQIVVDKAQKFQYELGQWDDPNAYIAVG
jgi:cytochrome b6-f complex iron-sulfur subunit